jgi:hypothetical protein
MALIVCPDCGKEFSDAAAACPNCGRPNGAARRAVETVPVRRRVGCAGQFAMLFIAIMVVGIFRAGCSQPKGREATADQLISAPMTPRPLDDAELQASAQIEVRKNLKDPESARFAGVRVHRSKAGIAAVCGSVNAKNGFGGYGGDKDFVVLGSIVLIEPDESDMLATFRKAQRTACVDHKSSVAT